MIKAICFDLDGVYFINGKSNFIKNVSKLGVSEDEVVRVFLKSDEMNKIYKVGKMNDTDFWTWAINEWGINMSIDEITKLLISGYELNEEVVRTVKDVKENGYKTLICTSNFPARINGLQNRFDFLKDFDAYVFSYEIGYNKPSKEIFEELIRKSGVMANEIVFSDDHLTNVESAKNTGIVSFVYEDFHKFIEKLRELGVNI